MKRILVPVDFSPAMEGTLTHAREMARALGAELHLVHVREIAAVPVFPAATIGYPGIGMPEMGMTGGLPVGAPGYLPADSPNDKKKSPLENLQGELTRTGVSTIAHEREGTVVEEILKTAQEISADLIVMGSHGHGPVYNLLVGSVTEGVLKAGRRPVLLVPAPATSK
jgi:nucleotide-binding universal stress UspA family protein